MNKINFNYRLYGRLKGRKSKKISNKEYQKIIFPFKNININLNDENILEIGSGNGENAVFLSTNKKNKIFVCEKFIDGNLNLINKIKNNNINNISIFDGNVNEFLEIIFEKEYFTCVWILFPDPWPKNKHHKRRLVNLLFFKKIIKFIKKNGYILIATDSKSYLRSILYNLYELKKILYWENQSRLEWMYENNNLIKTKYYKKALKSGRKPFFIRLRKI